MKIFNLTISSAIFVLAATAANAQSMNPSSVTNPARPDKMSTGGQGAAQGTVTTGNRAGANAAINDPARPDQMKAGGQMNSNVKAGPVTTGNRAGANAAINDPASPNKQTSKKTN